MSRFYLTEAAEMDLVALTEYISADNPQAAIKLLTQIVDLFPRLAEMPGMGRTRDDLLPGLRALAIQRYLILYRLASDGVEILRVVHGMRDLTAIFDSEPD